MVGRVCPQRAALGIHSPPVRRGEDTPPYRHLWHRHRAKVFNAPLAQARELLPAFLHEPRATWFAANLPALDSHPKTAVQVTDHYLTQLAYQHGCQLATFDQGLKHRSAVTVA